MKNHTKRRQAGFSAIELMLVLGVIAIATVAIIRAMGANTDKANSQIMMTDITYIINGIRSAYTSSDKGYDALNNSVAIALKVIPTNLRINGDRITNQFGGEVKIAPGSDVSIFTLTYDKVPSSVCQQVINGLGGGNFLKIEVNGTIVYQNDTNGTHPIAPAEVSSNCNNANNSVPIIYTAS